MTLQNSTRNQHFISQAEQRLNAINPEAPKEKQKIYTFNIVDRDSCEINLNGEQGNKIKKTLSIGDLFSFEAIEATGPRQNFETLFKKYEDNITTITLELIKKIELSEIESAKTEIINIFSLKFMNFIRNPYSIKKVLNTFPQLLKTHPINKVSYDAYLKVINGSNIHQAELLTKLGITEIIYRDWLCIIYLLLENLGDKDNNLLEHILKLLIEDKDLYFKAEIFLYKDHTCLLSDRGFSTPVFENEGHMSFDFNLCSTAFIRYSIVSLDFLIPKNTPKTLIASYKQQNKVINVSVQHDNLVELERYNKNIVFQCHENVFCSNAKPYGIVCKLPS